MNPAGESAAQSARYHFDTFCLDRTQQTLQMDGQLVSLGPRAVLLLAALIEAYPQSLSPQALREAAWGKTVVSDAAVAKQVSTLRRKLAALGLAVPAIQTLHGRGYRLAAELWPLVRREETAPPIPPPLNTAGRRWVTRWLPLGALAGLLLAGLMAWQQNRGEESALAIGEPPGAVGRILWVDDHPDNNLQERDYFAGRDIAVYPVTNTEEALLLLSLYRYQLVITDMGRGQDSLAGLKLLQEIRHRGLDTPVLLYTILTSGAQHQLVLDNGGQGIAEAPEQLYDLALPLVAGVSPGASAGAE